MRFFRFLIASVLYAIMSTLSVSAADYNLAVGESCTVKVDQSNGAGYTYIGIESVTCTNPSVYVEKIGLSVKATVKAYFSGDATVTSTIRYKLYSGQSYQYRYHRFTVACRGNGGGTGGGGTTEHGFKLDHNAITVNQGEMSTGINVTWSEISNCKCKWSIDDPDIAMVDENYSAHCYVIGGEKPGTTYLRARNEQGYTQTVKITVTPKTYNVGDGFFGLTIDSDKSYLICKVLNAEDKTCSVSLGATTYPNITIPYNVMGYTVTAIADKAFANKTIESLSLPIGIKRIGSRAFYQTKGKGLEEFVIPRKIEQIDSYAFEGSEISKIVMHSYYKTCNIGSEIFKNCSKLKEVKIARLKKLPSRTFVNCPFLQKVILGVPMIDIDKDAFVECLSLQEIRLPRTMRRFSGNFLGNLNIKDIYVKYATPPSSGNLKSFVNCKNVTLHVPLGCKDKYINSPDWNVFSDIVENDLIITYTYQNKTYSRDVDDKGSSVLRITEREDSIIKFGRLDYYDGVIFGLSNYSLANNKFKSIILPPVLVYIEEYALSNSYNISKIVIPKDVDYIASTAFNDCQNLSNFSVEEGNTRYISVDGVLRSAFSPATLFRVPCAKNGKLVFEKGIYQINEHAFGNCNKISEIILPVSLYTIKSNAFYGCESLKTLSLPKNLKVIEKKAFSSMNLESLHVNWETPIEIDEESFDNGIYDNTILFVPKGTKKIYQRSSHWNLFRTIKEEGETSSDDEVETVLYEGLNEDDATCDWTFETLHDDDFDIVPEGYEVWMWTEYNGKHFLKANAHEFPAPFRVRSMALSPTINLNGCKKFRISFDHAAKYQTTVFQWMYNVRLCINHMSDFIALENIPTLPTPGTWEFVNSGEIELELPENADLKKVNIGLYYYGDSEDGADAWEIKNIRMVGIGPASAIDEVTVDSPEANYPTEVYNLSGIKVADSTDNLPAGIYIVRRGPSVKKISIR